MSLHALVAAWFPDPHVAALPSPAWELGTDDGPRPPKVDAMGIEVILGGSNHGWVGTPGMAVVRTNALLFSELVVAVVMVGSKHRS